MTNTFETAELTAHQRGIVATSAFARYLDEFSRVDRQPISAHEPPALITRHRRYYSRERLFVAAWQDHGQPFPGWFDSTMQGFADLLTLPPDWDSYGGGPIGLKLVNTAITFVNELLGSRSPAPRVIPLSSGGLQLEWHRKGIDLEVVFDQAEEPFFYYKNRTTSEEAEETLREGRRLLASIVSRLE